MRRFASLFVLALVAAGPAGAQEPTEPSLYAVQVELRQQNVLAWRALNFERSLEIFRTMREITISRQDERKQLDVPDIEFILRDLEKIQAFSHDKKRVVKELVKEKMKSSDFRFVGDHRNALKRAQRSLELAESLFHENSYLVIDGKIVVAKALAIADEHESFATGISIVLKVQSKLEKLGLTNSHYHLDMLDLLTKLYFRQQDFESATRVGEKTIELYKFYGYEHTGESAMLTGIVAESFNRIGKHREALTYAGNGLNYDPPLDGVYGVACTRLLQEYARARIALGSSTDVARTFEKLLTVSDQFAAAGYFPLDKRLEYRDEYLVFLEKEGSTERAEEVRKEIDRLKLRAPLQKSRYSD